MESRIHVKYRTWDKTHVAGLADMVILPLYSSEDLGFFFTNSGGVWEQSSVVETG